MARAAAAERLRARAPAAVVPLLIATWLVLAATVANARPLKPSTGGDGARATESPPAAGDIRTVVGATEHDGAGCRGGHKFMMNIDMLGGIKDSGPSPGAGH